jgi:hypothetical protein
MVSNSMAFAELFSEQVRQAGRGLLAGAEIPTHRVSLFC